MSYESISLVEMDDFLRQRRFKPVDLYFRRRPVKEWVYERRLPQNANHFVPSLPATSSTGLADSRQISTTMRVPSVTFHRGAQETS